MADQESLDQSTRIQLFLDRVRAGDSRARAELLVVASERLQQLARKMLKCFPAVRRWEQTDDVMQNANLRLHRALESTVPGDARGFFALAATQIRRELIDLARHYSGPQGMGAHHYSQPPPGELEGLGGGDPSDSTYDPARLAIWTEFHQAVETLSEAEQEVVQLLWYQGLTQREVADLLDSTERVVGSLWRSARLKLHQKLKGQLPDL